MTEPSLRVTFAEQSHLPRVIALMREFAEFEELLDQFHATEELLAQHLFGESAAAELLVGFAGEEIHGYALFFRNFSSFQGRPGMYLEDIYVTPGARGIGLGKAMMLALFRIARERGMRRCSWAVLDWNQKAKQFYDSLGAKPISDWGRLSDRSRCDGSITWEVSIGFLSTAACVTGT